MKNLPPEAALPRAIQNEPRTAREKFGDRVMSIDQFVSRNQSHLEQTA